MLRPLFFTLLAVLTFSVHAQDIIEGEAKVAPSRLPLEELRAFAEIFERIRTSYVETVDDKTLLENAIHGMLSGLDPHSSYLGEEDFEDLRANTSGKFGGLGIEVGMEDGFIKVVSPIDDTPAQQAGILAGDLIIKLDDTPVKGLGLNEAVEKMRGEPGSPIVLTILREGENQPLEITIKRAEIKITSVKHKLLDDQYGYIRITQFQENTGADISNALQILTEKSDQPLKPLSGVILDLRNNPGGVLDAAVAVSDAFLESGLIVYTKGRIANADVRYEATIDTPAPDVPLVVLINGGSASASEIVAGALQDHGRAVIMGTQSFGKGSVQTVLPLNGEHALKLTTARYYTPNGRSIQAQGITPDIEVHQGKFTPENESRYYKEADLTGHLENPDEKKEKKVEDEENETKKLIAKDYQLNQALTMLKGMRLLASKQNRDSDDQTPAVPAITD
ncbi:S41 family peptidase [Bermanella sp. WJH001]|uniref:S41 family peptidase n=1 Tax=Bermanella sp. WJH001 TaxID=3048005 RepID=UPI0024BF0E82|nr:S41 family peptidase [Bermanella sp. WJH001]MDJ1538707.1 S41 family peptidase [Bermanella sp. WJH001]